MKILVTGADGQLGHELRNVLEAKRPGVTVYTDRAQLDICDAKAVMDYVTKGDFTHIVNCAAYTAVDKAEDEKSACSAVNVDAVSNLAMAAAETSAKILHISTDYVFDGNTCHPYKESDKPGPLSHYGSTKRRSETALLGLVPDAIIVRTGWLYSPYGHNFVKTILTSAKTRKTLSVVSDCVGTPTSAADLANMIYTILTAPQWLEGIYHYSNEGVASWYDFAEAILDLAGIQGVAINPVHAEEYPTAATRPVYSVLDKSKIKATYGVEIPYWRKSLASNLKRFDAQQQ